MIVCVWVCVCVCVLMTVPMRVRVFVLVYVWSLSISEQCSLSPGKSRRFESLRGAVKKNAAFLRKACASACMDPLDTVH